MKNTSFIFVLVAFLFFVGCSGNVAQTADADTPPDGSQSDPTTSDIRVFEVLGNITIDQQASSTYSLAYEDFLLVYLVFSSTTGELTHYKMIATMFDATITGVFPDTTCTFVPNADEYTSQEVFEAPAAAWDPDHNSIMLTFNAIENYFDISNYDTISGSVTCPMASETLEYAHEVLNPKAMILPPLINEGGIPLIVGSPMTLVLGGDEAAGFSSTYTVTFTTNEILNQATGVDTDACDLSVSTSSDTTNDVHSVNNELCPH